MCSGIYGLLTSAPYMGGWVEGQDLQQENGRDESFIGLHCKLYTTFEHISPVQ